MTPMMWNAIAPCFLCSSVNKSSGKSGSFFAIVSFGAFVDIISVSVMFELLFVLPGEKERKKSLMLNFPLISEIKINNVKFPSLFCRHTHIYTFALLFFLICKMWLSAKEEKKSRCHWGEAEREQRREEKLWWKEHGCRNINYPKWRLFPFADGA